MKTIAYLTLALMLLFPHASHASTPLQKLKTLFSHHFNSSYVKNQCGQNISNFVATAKVHGIDMRRGKLIYIRNKGGTDLDAIPAMRAREAGAVIDEIYSQYFVDSRYGHRQIQSVPNHVRVRQEGPSSWVYYHAILMFDGHIFDFDFTNTPTVLSLADYMQQMFIPPGREFHAFHRSKFGPGFVNDDLETFIQRVQDELVLTMMPADFPQNERFEINVSLREFRKLN